MPKAVLSNALPPPPSKKEAPGPYICPRHLKRGVFFNDRNSKTTFQCSGSSVRRSDCGERVKLYTGKTGQGGAGMRGEWGKSEGTRSLPVPFLYFLFSPQLFFVNFSPALHYLNAWNRQGPD